MANFMWGTELIVLLIASALMTHPVASTAIDNITVAAQDVAAIACPMLMLQSFGCPVKQTQSNARSSPSPWTTAPAGMGFDIVTLTTKLPIYFPSQGLSVNPANAKKTTVTIYTTINDYMAQLNPATMQTLKTGALDTDVKDMFRTYFGSFSSLVEAKQQVSISEGSLSNNATMLPRVKELLASLPRNYDAMVYRTFLDNFGTHIVQSGVAGGECELLTSVKSCFANADALLVQQQAELELELKTMQAPKGTKTNPTYAEYSRPTPVTMYGGDPALASPSQWLKRIASLAKQPALIEIAGLLPISDAAKDPVIAMNLKRAVTEHVQTALQERWKATMAANATEEFTVTAATSVDYDKFRTGIANGYNKCRQFFFSSCKCECAPMTQCPEPGSCSVACNEKTATQLVTGSMPQVRLMRGQKATVSPDGTKTCKTSCKGCWVSAPLPREITEMRHSLPFQLLPKAKRATLWLSTASQLRLVG